ncbi:hypothetical protein [Niabella sp.]|uniref:hypothetical protein n=1 Tax=Niabella sp. TaxID=1962976 RepID=UPI00260BBDC3|nr:hypothetical protein [Niabella sp.]
MKPQDILVILKLLSIKSKGLSQYQVAKAVGISPAELTKVFNRLFISGFIDVSKKQLNRQAIREFLIHGLKYVFPVRIGPRVRGIPTAYAASPINKYFGNNQDIYVWPFSKGTARGFSLSPLYKTVPKIIEEDLQLYELLAIIDTLRMGKAREVKAAIEELDKYLNNAG